MTQWIQDYLPGMEFLAEPEPVCPKCKTAMCLEDAEFSYGESCD